MLEKKLVRTNATNKLKQFKLPNIRIHCKFTSSNYRLKSNKCSENTFPLIMLCNQTKIPNIICTTYCIMQTYFKISIQRIFGENPN